MAETKETKNAGINFPYGSLDEMLRMMRKGREKGIVDCETTMKKFLRKECEIIDFNEIKKQFLGNGHKDIDLEEIVKKCRE